MKKLPKKFIKPFFSVIFILVFVLSLTYLSLDNKNNTQFTKISIEKTNLELGLGKEDLIIQENKNFKSGEYEYKSLIVENGVLTVDKNNWGPKKLVIKSKERIVIKKGTRIDLSGNGYEGTSRENKDQASDKKQGTGIDFEIAGGGGGHGGAGSSGDCFKDDKSQVYDTGDDSEDFGSGGGIGLKDMKGKGGDGGGFIKLIAPEIIIDGEITSNGENGKETGGGGAGGKIVVLANNIILHGKISANGGKGGDLQIQGAGGGGGGIIFLGNKIENKGKLEVYGGKGGQALDIYTGCHGKDGDDGVINIVF